MRDSGTDIVDALAAARRKGLVSLRFVTIFARRRDDGTIVPFCFWSDPVPAAVAIANRQTGLLETRYFIGDAVLQECDPVPRTTGVTVRSWNFTLNALHPTVLDMVTNHDVRLAMVEYHRVPGSTKTRRPVAAPSRYFLGRVDGAPRPLPAVGGESNIVFSCTSDTVQLTRVNPIKRSDVAQRRRDGDKQMQYVDVAADWPIGWGEASGSVG